MPFISFPCLIELAKTSNKVLKAVEEGHPYLVPNLRGKSLSFSLLSFRLAIGFSVDALHQLEEVPVCSLFAKSFYPE